MILWSAPQRPARIRLEPGPGGAASSGNRTRIAPRPLGEQPDEAGPLGTVVRSVPILPAAPPGRPVAAQAAGGTKFRAQTASLAER